MNLRAKWQTGRQQEWKQSRVCDPHNLELDEKYCNYVQSYVSAKAFPQTLSKIVWKYANYCLQSLSLHPCGFNCVL